MQNCSETENRIEYIAGYQVVLRRTYTDMSIWDYVLEIVLIGLSILKYDPNSNAILLTVVHLLFFVNIEFKKERLELWKVIFVLYLHARTCISVLIAF